MPSLQQLSLTDRKDEKNISGIDAFAGFKDLSSRTAEGRREPYTPKVLAEVLRNNPNLEALFVDPFFLQPCPEFALGKFIYINIYPKQRVLGHCPYEYAKKKLCNFNFRRTGKTAAPMSSCSFLCAK